MPYNSSKNAVINVKVDSSLKADAVKLADQLGVPLSLVIQGGLRQFVAKRGISFFSYQPFELKKKKVSAKLSNSLTPSPYLRQAISEARSERAKGNNYNFKSAAEAVKFLRGNQEKTKV